MLALLVFTITSDSYFEYFVKRCSFYLIGFLNCNFLHVLALILYLIVLLPGSRFSVLYQTLLPLWSHLICCLFSASDGQELLASSWCHRTMMLFIFNAICVICSIRAAWITTSVWSETLLIFSIIVMSYITYKKKVAVFSYCKGLFDHLP